MFERMEERRSGRAKSLGIGLAVGAPAAVVTVKLVNCDPRGDARLFEYTIGWAEGSIDNAGDRFTKRFSTVEREILRVAEQGPTITKPCTPSDTCLSRSPC